MSSGVPFRRIGVAAIICSRRLSGMFAIHVLNDAVSIAPGSTALTRIFGASSAAISRVI